MTLPCNQLFCSNPQKNVQGVLARRLSAAPCLKLLYFSNLCPLLSSGTLQEFFYFLEKKRAIIHIPHLSDNIIFHAYGQNSSFIPSILSCWPGYLTPRTKSTTLAIQDEVWRSLEWWLSPQQQHSSSSALPLPGISVCLAFHEPHLHKGELSAPGFQQIKAWEGKYYSLSGITAFFLGLPYNDGGGKKEEKACRVQQSCIERDRI